MLPTDVLAYTRAVPFRPFRLVLNSGKSYDVRHPEMVRVTVSSVLYFYATDPEGPAERWETVSLPLLQSIEHIEALRKINATHQAGSAWRFTARPRGEDGALARISWMVPPARMPEAFTGGPMTTKLDRQEERGRGTMNPGRLVKLVEERRVRSKRKFRLAAVACCGQAWPKLTKEEGLALEVIGRYADGQAKYNEMRLAVQDMRIPGYRSQPLLVSAARRDNAFSLREVVGRLLGVAWSGAPDDLEEKGCGHGGGYWKKEDEWQSASRDVLPDPPGLLRRRVSAHLDHGRLAPGRCSGWPRPPTRTASSPQVSSSRSTWPSSRMPSRKPVRRQGRPGAPAQGPARTFAAVGC